MADVIVLRDVAGTIESFPHNPPRAMSGTSKCGTQARLELCRRVCSGSRSRRRIAAKATVFCTPR